MKYIWEPRDIQKGKKFFFWPSSTDTCTIVQLESPAEEHRTVAYERQGIVSVPYSKTEMADLLTKNESIPI